ncbi:MAG: hypothetical protein JST11_20940 [Acidobacteria bacterium]|nr:hypothetical protein [Acidobacteriota bacterium]
MPIAKITGQGLAAIALSVALLWGCLITEQVMLNHSYVRRAQVMRELRQLQLLNRTQPASTPAPAPSHRLDTTVG